MFRLFVFALLAGLGWLGYQRYASDAFILTDSRAENVEKLRALAAKLNRAVPKEIDAETTLLGVDVTSRGVVNRYKTTVPNAAAQFTGDRDNPVRQTLRREACADHYWRMAMGKGFSIGYAYVDVNGNPLAVYTFRSADCGGG